MAANLRERFMDKVSPEPNTGCWLWLGYTNTHGYGHFYVNPEQRVRPAHCIAYELLVKPIPPGLELDHLCRVRSCVNPAHLDPVTGEENVRRGEAGINNEIKTHCPRGHEYNAQNTYNSPTAGRICRACKRLRRSLGEK